MKDNYQQPATGGPETRKPRRHHHGWSATLVQTCYSFVYEYGLRRPQLG